MHDVLVKLDILGHDDPTMLKKLEDLTGIAPQKVPLHDRAVFESILSLFTGPGALGVTPEEIGAPTGTLGIPEFGTRFVRQMLVDTQPHSMEELIRISGLSHGTDVWVGNAQDIIKAGIAPLKKCICTRDDIMNQLIKWGVEPKTAFTIMESVRKGKGLKPEWITAMQEAGTPGWFIECCQKIKYMFPKAHAVAYVTMALRIAYFKVYHPGAYYACFLKRNAEAFDGSSMVAQLPVLKGKLAELQALEKEEKAKKEDQIALYEILIEMVSRGISLRPISLYESDAENFLLMPDNTILPPLSSLPGVGLAAAQNLARARDGGPFLSQEDMTRRKVAKSVVQALAASGALGDLPETSQTSLFDFG
jgi:DNA polymerase-3 subunit alpha (Gram-positive type)